ncbi:MAG: branched-chain amino acid ABC transporter permease [Planctomycetota bacterium]|jgi:branched-chain amino acid transport system permease protein
MSWIELEPLICQVGILAILALSLNMICGMTGLLQLGHAGFYAIGAYTAGLVAIYWTIPELGWFNFLIGGGAAMVVAALFALVIGLPCLRLRGDYLAIATLGFGEIVRLILDRVEFSGGAMFEDEPIGGSSGIAFTEWPDELWPEFPEYSAEYAKYWVIWAFVLLTYILLRNIKFSRAGRAFQCIREDEIAARAMGINVPYYKVVAFLLSAGFAGLAGALFFHYQLDVKPGTFNLLTSIQVLLMVVLGGMGSLSGAIIAAVLLGILPQVLRHIDLSGVEWLPEALRISFGEYNQLLYALLLILLIRVMPNGILGMNELPAWLRRSKKEGTA